MNWQDILKSKYRSYDNIGLKSLYDNLRRGVYTFKSNLTNQVLSNNFDIPFVDLDLIMLRR